VVAQLNSTVLYLTEEGTSNLKQDTLAKQAFHAWIAEYPWDHFITFTFKNSKYGAPPYKRVVSCINRLNKIVNNLNFMALATEREDWSIKQSFLVLERGKLPHSMRLAPTEEPRTLDEKWKLDQSIRGRLHLHGLMRCSGSPLLEQLKSYWTNENGWCSITPVISKERTVNYVNKYVGKEWNNPEFINNFWMLGEDEQWRLQ
jgi:hypothetical protein